MNLKKEDRDALVAVRLQRTKETIEELKSNMKLGYWRIAANRLYYACYYAVSALLIKNNLTTHTHSGVMNQLSEHFIKKGLLTKEHGRFFKGLYELRQDGDYGDWKIIREEDIVPLLEPAQKFIEDIEKLINALNPNI